LVVINGSRLAPAACRRATRCAEGNAKGNVEKLRPEDRGGCHAATALSRSTALRDTGQRLTGGAT